MLHRSYIPALPLGDFVDNFWFFDDYVPPFLKECILPSGTIEMVINLRDDELRIYDPLQPERFRRFSGALVSGAYSRFFVIDTLQEASIMGAHFRPGGAFPFLGAQAGEVADLHVNLQDLWGPAAKELRERLCVLATPELRFRLLEEALTAHLFCSLEHHGAVKFSLDLFARADAGLTVREVAERVGLSQRRLIEVFTAQVGMTPKLFTRVQRFQRARALIHHIDEPDWPQLAVDCGYFDQSHLIRDFRAFAGLSPTSYFRQQRSIRVNHIPLAA
jgi:AraC-like DNA-binding protein